MTLAAQAELVIDRAGNVVSSQVIGSGNPDFDRAVRDAIAETVKYAVPPLEL